MAFEKDLFFFRRKEISHDIDFKRVRVNHQGESRKTDAFGYTFSVGYFNLWATRRWKMC
jgi:hypothetical protein